MKFTLNLKNPLFYVSPLLFIYSCTEDPIDPEEKEDPDKTMVYKFDRFELVNAKLYVGSKDGAIDKSESFNPNSYFTTSFGKESKLSYFKYDSLMVKRDTLTEFPNKYESNVFGFKVGEKDSLFRWNIYADFWQYYGTYPSTKEEIIYESNYSRLIKKRKEASFYLDNQSEGLVSDKDFFWGNTYHFPSKDDMTETTDTLAYANVKYYYKLIKK